MATLGKGGSAPFLCPSGPEARFASSGSSEREMQITLIHSELFSPFFSRCRQSIVYYVTWPRPRTRGPSTWPRPPPTVCTTSCASSTVRPRPEPGPGTGPRPRVTRPQRPPPLAPSTWVCPRPSQQPPTTRPCPRPPCPPLTTLATLRTETRLTTRSQCCQVRRPLSIPISLCQPGQWSKLQSNLILCVSSASLCLPRFF